MHAAYYVEWHILGNNRHKRDIAIARQILSRRGRNPSPQTKGQPEQPMRCPRCGKRGLRLLGFTTPDGMYHTVNTALPPCDSS